MELYLQFGYGMMALSCQLIKDWGGGKVILSPRDLSDKQLLSLSKELHRVGGEVLLDPQFYLPHADHARLRTHEYWPGDYESTAFWSGAGLTNLLTKVSDLNSALGALDLLLPGLYAAVVDDDWLWRQESLIKAAHNLNNNRFRLLATVALSEKATLDAEQIDSILEASDTWDVDGVYLVCEHPHGEYLVSEPIWLANVLCLTAGLRLKGMDVVLGYCQHQMLIAACASATAIASGNWVNVRSFPPEKFQIPEDDDPKNHRPWYYCPPTLSEYRIPMLDIALRQGVLTELATPAVFGSSYADRLFASPQPSSGEFGEPEAFRHYLQCLRSQTTNARLSSYGATVDAYRQTLALAATSLKRLHAAGISGAHRDFEEIVHINLAALGVLETDCGPLLRHHWDTL